jgi:hypothetical protein
MAQTETTPRWALVNGKKVWIVGKDTAGLIIYETGHDAEYNDQKFTPLYHFDKLKELP